jgi:hypothetical protein
LPEEIKAYFSQTGGNLTSHDLRPHTKRALF